MSKPLELTVYAKEPGRYGREATYHSPDGLWAYPESHVDGYAAAKRLTDTELAAEWHANESEAWLYLNRHPDHFKVDHAERLEEQESILRRFATLPHYDEQDQA